jgi:hypothetical protein
MARLSVDDCVAAVIHRVDKLISPWIESRIPAGEIYVSQYIALTLVRDGVASNPRAPACERGHTTGAVTRLVKRSTWRWQRTSANGDRGPRNDRMKPAPEQTRLATNPILKIEIVNGAMAAWETSPKSGGNRHEGQVNSFCFRRLVGNGRHNRLCADIGWATART